VIPKEVRRSQRSRGGKNAHNTEERKKETSENKKRLSRVRKGGISSVGLCKKRHAPTTGMRGGENAQRKRKNHPSK